MGGLIELNIFKSQKLRQRQIFEISGFCPQSVLIAIFIPLLQASPHHWSGPASPPGHWQLICRVILGPGTFNSRDLIDFSLVRDKYSQETHGRSLEAGPLHIFLNGKRSGEMIFVQRVCVRQRRARPSPGTAVAAAGHWSRAGLLTGAWSCEMEKYNFE